MVTVATGVTASPSPACGGASAAGVSVTSSVTSVKTRSICSGLTSEHSKKKASPTMHTGFTLAWRVKVVWKSPRDLTARREASTVCRRKNVE